MNPPFHPPFMFHFVGALIRLLLLFGGAFFLLWYYLRSTRNRNQPSATNADQKVILTLRLQAYERFVMFLERINPSNLVMRLNSPELTSQQFQAILVRTIREEFEYNLSQQLYISNHSWEMIKNAKEETITLINQASAKVAENAHSSDLVKAIFEVSISKGKLPVEIANDEIKNELQNLF